MIKKYANQQAVEELVRRHMLPMVQNNEQIRSRVREREADGPAMELLTETATRARVPMDRRQELRQIQRKYQNVQDERLLAQARDDLGPQGTQMMRRLIERGGNRRDGDNPDTHQTGQMKQGSHDKRHLPLSTHAYNALLAKHQGNEESHPFNQMDEETLRQLADQTQYKDMLHEGLQEQTGRGLPSMEEGDAQ